MPQWGHFSHVTQFRGGFLAFFDGYLLIASVILRDHLLSLEIEGCHVIHIVGNGTSDGYRHNAHTLDWSGNAWYAGTVEGTAMILSSPNGTRFKVTVANDGTLSASAITE